MLLVLLLGIGFSQHLCLFLELLDLLLDEVCQLDFHEGRALAPILAVAVANPEEVLVESLVKHLQHHEIKACMRKVNPGTNSVSAVIQNQVSEHNVDLLIMGGHGTPTLKQKVFGTVTKNLLSSMITPVLMSN